jgi:DNA-binding CsgD family transcriptional regulator
MAMHRPKTSGLLGRYGEREALRELLAAVRAGDSSVLVLRGEAGCGKTALLDELVDAAPGCLVARATGIESEMELAYAGLHQLCRPMLGAVPRLPGPQRDALSVAFGLSGGGPPDRFLVALAVLTLLAEVASEQPVVCVVDDAQWLDQVSAQSLVFVARRMQAESVGLVFAVREPDQEGAFAGLPELPVAGLSEADSRGLLRTVAMAPLDEQVCDRIIAEAGGNPLALLELPRGLSPAELAGGYGLTPAGPVPGRIEESFTARLRELPVATQRLLLAAAAEPLGDMSLLWRALATLGIATEAVEPAERAGLIQLGSRLRFRHPLVRSAAYRAGSSSERQAVHRALAEATDRDADPDRRAWHLARASIAPDEAVARELEDSAGRARARGGLGAAAAFLEWATEMTPEPARRSVRAVAAAQAKLDAAAPEAATKLLATAEAGPLDSLHRAKVARVRAEVAFFRTRGGDAPRLLLEAARSLESLDVALARETLLQAFGAAIFAGRLSGSCGARHVAAAARAGPPAPAAPRAADLLLDGLAIRFTEGYAAGLAPLRRAIDAFCSDAGNTRWTWLACRVASDLWDDAAWHQLAECQLGAAHAAGAISEIPLADTYRAGVCVHAGEFDRAAALIDEADAITEATGGVLLGYTSVVLAAWRGREVEARGLIDASLRDANERGEGRAVSMANYATAVLYNGLGRYDAVLAAARQVAEYDELGLPGWALSEAVEAGARTGSAETAVAALERLQERTRAAGTDWALGIEARSRALVSEGSDAEDAYRESIERLEATRIAVHHARACLVYGEWLRRAGRRLDARSQLRRAYEALSSFGAEAFAERARRELLATGETIRKRCIDTLDVFTAQERLIAGLAADGRTNPEIGAQLFISPRTVEYHLHKVFSKLEISSRRELRDALAERHRAQGPG